MKEQKPLNQTAEVLYELLNSNFITRAKIFNETGILNLTARITNLRALGLQVACKRIETKNKHGRTISYGTWSIAGESKKAVEIYKRINTTPEQKKVINKLAKAILPAGKKIGNQKIKLC